VVSDRPQLEGCSGWVWRAWFRGRGYQLKEDEMNKAPTASGTDAVKLSIIASVAGLFLFALLLFGNAPAAQAHDPSVYHPSDPNPYTAFRTVVTIRSTFYGHHTRVDVCDRDSDGHYAYAHVWDSVGNFYTYPQTRDQDGYGGRCNFGYAIPKGVVFYNVCVQNEGCGSPKYIGWARLGL
jgi:hypothetical protein